MARRPGDAHTSDPTSLAGLPKPKQVRMDGKEETSAAGGELAAVDMEDFPDDFSVLGVTLGREALCKSLVQVGQRRVAAHVARRRLL